MTATPIAPHDPDNCQEGEECKPCKIAENKRELDRLASKARVPATARTRALGILAKQQADLDVTRSTAGRLLAAVLVMFAIVGCAVPAEAVKQADTEAAACHGLAVNPANPPDVRAVGARESLAWRQQRRTLTGKDVPTSETWALIPAEFLPPPAAPGTPR